jgi:hypothetical protein
MDPQQITRSDVVNHAAGAPNQARQTAISVCQVSHLWKYRCFQNHVGYGSGYLLRVHAIMSGFGPLSERYGCSGASAI